MIELLVAMTIILAVLLPLFFSFAQLHKSARISYQRGIAMEMIDGEMEVLLAGEWREFNQGVQSYALRGDAAANLPPGKAQLTVSGNHLRLEWLPEKPDTGGKVIREAVAK
jgi:hypothetical protein